MSTPARVPKRPPLRDGRVLAPRGASLGRTTGARRAGTTDLEAPPLSGTEWGRLQRGWGTNPEGRGAGSAVHTTAAAGELSVCGLGTVLGGDSSSAVPACPAFEARTVSSVEGCAAWVLWEPFL